MSIKSLQEIKPYIDELGPILASIDNKIRALWPSLPQAINPLVSSLIKRDAIHRPYLNIELNFDDPLADSFFTAFKSTLSLIDHAFTRFDYSYAVPMLFLTIYHVFNVKIADKKENLILQKNLQKIENSALFLLNIFLQVSAFFDENLKKITEIIEILVPNFTPKVDIFEPIFIFAAFLSKKNFMDEKAEKTRKIIQKIDKNEISEAFDFTEFFDLLTLFSTWLNLLKNDKLAQKIQNLVPISYKISEENSNFLEKNDPHQIFNFLISDKNDIFEKVDQKSPEIIPVKIEKPVKNEKKTLKTFKISQEKSLNILHKKIYKISSANRLNFLKKQKFYENSHLILHKKAAKIYFQDSQNILKILPAKKFIKKFYETPQQSLFFPNFSLYSADYSQFTLILKSAAENKCTKSLFFEKNKKFSEISDEIREKIANENFNTIFFVKNFLKNCEKVFEQNNFIFLDFYNFYFEILAEILEIYIQNPENDAEIHEKSELFSLFSNVKYNLPENIFSFHLEKLHNNPLICRWIPLEGDFETLDKISVAPPLLE